MINHRLLTGLLAATLLSSDLCASAEVRIVPLEDIFQSAENNSNQLRPFIDSEKEALKEISVAKSGRLPDISANLSLSYIGDGFTTKRDFSDYQKAAIPHFGSTVGVSISQPVYTGGAINSVIELAQLKSTASRFATDFQKDNIRFRLTGYYLDIYKNSNLRKVVENNLLYAHQVLDDMHSRFEQGVALQNDITRYELLVSQLELQLIKIDNTLEILNRNLITVSGLPQDLVIIPDSTIILRALPLNEEQWWQGEAYSNSPALKLAGKKLDICRKAEDLVRSERLPKIGLQASWSLDGPILVEIPPINRNLSYWYIGVGVSYNLSSLYKTNKSLAKSRSASLKAADDLAVASENLTLDIHDGYIRYLEAYQELKTQEKNVELAERNYNITATRYSADMALITDMLDAANAKLDAEQQLVNARINIIYYYYRLLFTSGKI